MIEEHFKHKYDYKKEHNKIMSQPKHFSSLQQIYFFKQQQQDMWNLNVKQNQKKVNFS